MQTNKNAGAPKKTRKTGNRPLRHATRPHPAAHPAQALAAAVADGLIQQSQGASLDQAITRALKSASHLPDEARRGLVQTLTEINRYRARLGWHLEQEGVPPGPSALLSAWTVFAGRGQRWEDAAGIEDLALMRKLARRQLDEPQMPEATRLECPPAWEGVLREALGGRFAAEMQAALAPPPVDLRVNTLKATREVAIERLHWEKIEAKPLPTSPWGLRCGPGTNVSATRAFRDGLVEFQDEASQLAVLLCDARPGMQVMDFCSGTGGKTLALAAAMQNRGHIVACDISEVRLARAKIRLKRAGAENAERMKLPPADTKDMKRLHGRFHRVLVDAPCSGTGSWRRNPDVRWSPHASNLAELTALQASILARASNYVQPGGVLVYATCSLLPAENERQVEAFLASRPDFEAVGARAHWTAVTDIPWPCRRDDALQLSPAQNGTDGFFAAVLRKAAIRA